MKPDKELWDDFRKGENYALSEIYFQHIQMLYRYGQKFSNDDELIKDTIQDLFFDLLRTRKNLGDTDNICFYLIASFRRKLVKRINKKIPIEYYGDQKLIAKFVYSAEYDLILREDLTRREMVVKMALAELSHKQREILYYKFICNFNYVQICDIMNLQYDSARKQVSRALKSMKEILAGSEIFVFFQGFFRR